MLAGSPRTRRLVRRGAPLLAAVAVGAGATAAIDSTHSSATPAPQAAAAATTHQTALVTGSLTPAEIYRRDAAGVVDISVTSTSTSQGDNGLPFWGGGGGAQQTQGEGSGFVLDKNGDIVTNDHVVSGASSITVRFKDGTKAKATVVGTDPSSDLAVIKVDVPASKLTVLPLGSSTNLQPGAGVVAIGSPFGLPGTITAGIVSATGRQIQAPNGYTITGAIQTDAAINPGNSGGPLIDTHGDVIGVNAQIESRSDGNEGVGFAIPIDTVKSVTAKLVSGAKVQHPLLGVRIADTAQGQGATVEQVQAGTPAASAGLKQGDVITAVDGQAVASAEDLTSIIGSHQPGDHITVTITRNGQSQQVQVTLGTRSS